MATPTAATVTQVVTKVVTSSTPSSTARVSPQGGILEGGNPSVYDPKNPLTLFIIQAGIILIMCRLLHYPLSKLRQPRVIAEVIGGILLGPSVMGHIPGFSNAIFPAVALPNLTLVANLGLVLFLFLVGLEVDLRFLASNWRPALSVGALGMALPFGLGCGISYGLYHQFRTDPGLKPISFGVYMLFVGVAMAITAFPVLCRILTELKLLRTPVGVIVLSAGVGNDVVGWILLALCVALVNAGDGLTALWVLLVAVGYTLFLVFAVRPAFMMLLRKTGSLQNGPPQSVVAVTVLMALTSAFFTGIIGIHPIFGGFIVGLICPHEGGFAIKLTEKIEDLVGVLFLPLYFALSGLSTNLGLLNNGITWGYVFGVIAVAFFAKVAGGTLAAKLNGFVWRESFTIGTMMSCKGLVELIVLNIGLQADILSQRTFTIFVLMALVTTFATTPLVSLLYPHWYQVKIEAWKRGEIDWDGNRLNTADLEDEDTISLDKLQGSQISKLLTYLRLDSMPGVLTLVSLLGTHTASTTISKTHPARQGSEAPDLSSVRSSKHPVRVHGIRLMELGDRESSVMKASEIEEYTAKDPIVNTFRTFGYLNKMAVSGALLLAPEASFAATLADKAKAISADLVLIPWAESEAVNEEMAPLSSRGDSRFANGTYSQFVSTTLRYSSSNTAVFIDRGFSSQRSNDPPKTPRNVTELSSRSMAELPTLPPTDLGHHIFFPYFGSEDDKLALRFILQLAENPAVTATIVHFELPDTITEKIENTVPEISTESKFEATATTAPVHSSRYAAFFSTLRDSLPSQLSSRIVFETLSSTAPLCDAHRFAIRETGTNSGDLIVLGRNSRLGSTFRAEVGEAGSTFGSEAKKSLGLVAERMVGGGLNASLLVIKSSDEEPRL